MLTFVEARQPSEISRDQLFQQPIRRLNVLHQPDHLVLAVEVGYGVAEGAAVVELDAMAVLAAEKGLEEKVYAVLY